MALPDFAQFIEMETKKIKHFLAVWFTNELILHKTTKQQKSLCKKCVRFIHESIELNKRLTAANFQHNKTFSFVLLLCVRSIN